MDLRNSVAGRINRTFPLTGGGTRGSRTGRAQLEWRPLSFSCATWPLGAQTFFLTKQDERASSTQSTEWWGNPPRSLCLPVNFFRWPLLCWIRPMVGVEEWRMRSRVSYPRTRGRPPGPERGLQPGQREDTPLHTERSPQPSCATPAATRSGAD